VGVWLLWERGAARLGSGDDDAGRTAGRRGTPVVDGTQDAAETIKADCPADGCDGDRASYEMRPKPGGSYELRVFTCVECGHTWRET
jgi:DNA-directed RNA polymerase subunit M